MKNNYLPIILLATFLGFLAGATATLLVSSYNTGYSGGLSFNRDLNLNDYAYFAPNLVISDPKKVVVSQDVKVDETIKSVRSSLLGVFLKNNQADAYYELNNPVAQALAATNDGWLMAAWPKTLSKAELDNIVSNYVAIDSGHKIYIIDQALMDFDQTGSFIFLHLKNASGLNVRRLIPAGEMKVGQSLIIADSQDKFLLDILGAKIMNSSLLSSDVYSQKFQLAQNNELKTIFVFNLAGEIAGAVDNQGRFLSSPELEIYWRSLLKSGKLSWPVFGANYLNLSAVAGNSVWPEKGALLKGRDEAAAVLKNGPADKAGLKAGDISLRINGAEVN